MPQDTRHYAGIGADIAQQDQRSNNSYSVCLAVMAPSLLTDG